MDKQKTLAQAHELLLSLYWNMIDNRKYESPKEIKRLDTIIGKIAELENIMREAGNDI